MYLPMSRTKISLTARSCIYWLISSQVPSELDSQVRGSRQVGTSRPLWCNSHDNSSSSSLPAARTNLLEASSGSRRYIFPRVHSDEGTDQSGLVYQPYQYHDFDYPQDDQGKTATCCTVLCLIIVQCAGADVGGWMKNVGLFMMVKSCWYRLIDDGMAM